MILAMIRRWFYLLFVGMWRGEVAITYSDSKGICAVCSGRHGAEGKQLKVWWMGNRPFIVRNKKQRPA